MHWLFCKWGKWETFDRGPISRWYFNLNKTIVTGWFEKQRRTCDICGKTELRTIETETD
jgi:hypothetical protein